MMSQHCHRIFVILVGILISGQMTTARNLQTDDINEKLLSTIQSYMNVTANPCENFYSYACGNWTHGNDEYSFLIPDTISTVDYLYDEQLKQILENGAQSKNIVENEVYHKLSDFYESCKKMESYKVAPCLEIVKPTEKDEWPQEGDSWNPQEKWNIWSTMGRLTAYGFNGPFYTFDLNPLVDATYEPEFGAKNLDHEIFYLNGQWFVSDENLLRLNKLTDVFINKLVALYETQTETPTVKMTITEWQQEIEHFDFQAYFSALFGHDNFGNLTVAINNVEHFRKVADLIHATSQDALIHIIKRSFHFYLLSKLPNRGQWSKTCVHTMRDLVPLAVDFLYEQEIYTHEREKTDVVIEKVFRSLQQKFAEIIEEHADEFSATEIENLKEKILKMKLIIGNLPQGADDHIYEDYFHSWQVMKDDFYRNFLNTLKRPILDGPELLKLKKFAVLRIVYDHSMATPFYQSEGNVVILPHAYIRFPMVHPEFHELFLYAELGNSIGHEIMHGFDTKHVKRDATGKAWNLTVYDKPKFATALECLHQEKTFSVNEKIGDFSGFRMAYDTYFKRSMVPELALENGLSQKQLFFIKFAQLFCNKGSSIIYDNSHDSPGERVRQVVTNSPDFEEIFSCPLKTDDEQRVKKCRMW